MAVLQEVAQPGLPFHDHPVYWRGTNPRKGVAIVSCSAAFTIAPVEAPPDLAPRTAAVTVGGPTSFLLVAMWAHPAPNYADNAIAVVRAWQARAPELPLVVAGDSTWTSGRRCKPRSIAGSRSSCTTNAD